MRCKPKKDLKTIAKNCGLNKGRSGCNLSYEIHQFEFSMFKHLNTTGMTRAVTELSFIGSSQ